MIVLLEDPTISISPKKWSTPPILNAVLDILKAIPFCVKKAPAKVRLKLLFVAATDGVIVLNKNGLNVVLVIAGSELSIKVNNSECLNTPSNLFNWLKL